MKIFVHLLKEIKFEILLLYMKFDSHQVLRDLQRAQPMNIKTACITVYHSHIYNIVAYGYHITEHESTNANSNRQIQDMTSS